MSASGHPFFELLQRDKRYRLEAYQFVREGLSFAHDVLALGDPEAEGGDPGERHLTGQELCEAIRQYAVRQYGYMAKVVLRNWGIHTTSDLGNIVYNLIEIKMMKKSATDRREDFDGVYDFEEVFSRQFQFENRDQADA
ncbi:MAG: hypothetical protein R3E01_31090 [Pirellulaceae bacterium]|nr:hypothetical protein [Planctomycetales bacterium]